MHWPCRLWTPHDAIMWNFRNVPPHTVPQCSAVAEPQERGLPKSAYVERVRFAEVRMAMVILVCAHLFLASARAYGRSLGAERV
eukprot:12058962-Prorocentrum_lima.AAC.1